MQAMRWDQLDLEGATWTIPASTSKSGEAMTIHLPSAALEILKRRQGNDSDFVLPGHGAGTTIGTESPHLGEWVDRGW